MLLRDLKSIFHKELDGIYGKEEVSSFFYMLIEHHLNLERFVLALQPKLTISKEEEGPFFEALSDLRLQRPVQYHIGKTHFMDMDIEVDENVLIPRPETEELVRWVLEDVQIASGLAAADEKKESSFILDIGTGSGCIAISLAKNLPETQVHALDISGEALAVASKNADSLKVDVTFTEVDILDIGDSQMGNSAVRYDIVVSNPPYVRKSEIGAIRKNVTEYEPALALFVSDEDPLRFYKAIARFAQHNLKDNGKLYLEINQYLSEETVALLRSHNFSEIELRKDMFGNDRMIKCSR